SEKTWQGGASAAALGARGHSLMVKFQPSKLAMRVRFPLPALRSLFRLFVKNLLRHVHRRGFSSRLRSSALLPMVVIAFAADFLWVTVPLAFGRDLNPVEMIEDGLPSRETMSSASKKEFLSATCRAVKRYRSVAVSIVSAAVAARHEDAGDIV